MAKYILGMCLVVAMSATSATDFCRSDLCPAQTTHIACNNPGAFASNCIDPKTIELDESLQEVLIEAHNEKRNEVAGGIQDGDVELKPACRMATIQWDPELAEVAHYNVLQCRMNHDQCRNTDAFEYAGQNLALSSFYERFGLDTPAMLRRLVGMWYSEIKDVRQSIIDRFTMTQDMIGHFTAMVNEKNIRVGCAASTYRTRGAPYSIFLLACNYATTNMLNFPVYRSCERPATDCQSGTNPEYPNLCSAAEIYEVNRFY